jgi:flagellar basal body-associated protein FliL
MAEEEVLTEQEAPQKKGRSGMNPIIILVVVVLGFVVIAALIFMLMGKIGKGNSSAPSTTTIDIEACEDKYKVFVFGEDQLKFKLKDKQEYLMSKVALCVPTATADEKLTEKVPLMKAIMTQYFLRFTSEDVFGPQLPTEALAPATDKQTEDIFTDGAVDDIPDTPEEKFKLIKKGLKNELNGTFKELGIIDVYLYEYEPARTPF